MSTATIVLPRPLPHQEAPLLDPARWKLWNWGRRTGKSRAAIIAAVCGHGPCDDRGVALRRGMRHGMDVVWLAPDYSQASIIWEEDIKPRFHGQPGVRTNDTKYDVEIPGGGRLLLRSCENPNAVRGSGKQLAGVILDEFAHVLRGQYVWRSVVRPACMDNGAWAIWGSTPKRGSFYNQRALEVKRGKRKGWHFSHLDARNNVAIAPNEFTELVGEYEEGTDELREEVYAELLEGGAGLAFPNFVRALNGVPIHVVPAVPALPPGWRFAAGLDWGYAKKAGAYYLVAFGPERRKRVVWEKIFGETEAFEVGRQVANESRHWPPPEFIVADEAMWHDGNAVGVNVATEFLRGLRSALGPAGTPAVLPAPHRKGSRVARKNLLHTDLRFRLHEDGTLKPWDAPRLTISEACPELARCLETLPLDEKRPEDVDTAAWDHPYDALTYLLAHDPPSGEAPSVGRDQDRHPGLDPATGQRRRSALAPWEQQVIDQMDTPPGFAGGGYRVPRAFEAVGD